MAPTADKDVLPKLSFSSSDSESEDDDDVPLGLQQKLRIATVPIVALPPNKNSQRRHNTAQLVPAGVSRRPPMPSSRVPMSHRNAYQYSDYAQRNLAAKPADIPRRRVPQGPVLDPAYGRMYAMQGCGYPRSQHYDQSLATAPRLPLSPLAVSAMEQERLQREKEEGINLSAFNQLLRRTQSHRSAKSTDERIAAAVRAAESTPQDPSIWSSIISRMKHSSPYSMSVSSNGSTNSSKSSRSTSSAQSSSVFSRKSNSSTTSSKASNKSLGRDSAVSISPTPPSTMKNAQRISNDASSKPPMHNTAIMTQQNQATVYKSSLLVSSHEGPVNPKQEPLTAVSWLKNVAKALKSATTLSKLKKRAAKNAEQASTNADDTIGSIQSSLQGDSDDTLLDLSNSLEDLVKEVDSVQLTDTPSEALNTEPTNCKLYESPRTEHQRWQKIRTSSTFQELQSRFGPQVLDMLAESE